MALKRLIHRYGLLMRELGRRPGELRRLVSASGAVFDTLAGESGNISTSVARLPGSLRATESALAEVRRFAPRPPERARVAARADPRAARHQRGAHAVLQDDDARSCATDPPVRARGRGRSPTTCAVAANGLAKATPDLTTALQETNRFFNIGAYNPGGAESLAGLAIAQQRARSEGFLYWLAWTSQNGVSLLQHRRRPGRRAGA